MNLKRNKIDEEIERVSHDMREIKQKINKTKTEMKQVSSVKDNLNNMSPELITKIKQKIKAIALSTMDPSNRNEGHNENAIYLLSIIEKQIVELFRKIETK